MKIFPPLVSKSYGFTLVEMMIVVIIMAILASIALPNFVDQMAQKRTQQGAMEIINIFGQARANAALSNKTATITIANSNLDYTVSFLDLSNPPATKITKHFELDPNLNVTTNVVTGTDNTVEVTASGGVSTPAFFRICNSNSSVVGYTVWINARGIAKFQSGQRSGLGSDGITDTSC